MTRKEAIECLNFQNEKFFGGQSEALKIAIASLKTDEAYQLEYENRDFVEITEGITNGEVLKLIFPTAELMLGNSDYIPDVFSVKEEWWNAPYKKEGE